MKNPALIILLVLINFACQQAPEITFESAQSEKYRPIYHFTPPTGWMNDPNGMVFYENTYHLFYQHYPDSTVWGPMHWGHATSENLIDWEHQPIAISPDSLGYIFSGSAVFDVENSSGLGTSENPPLVAIYTYHDMEGEQSGKSDYQSQAIAYSLDKGATWEKYDQNPVLPNQGIRDFRDPKVMPWTFSDGKKGWLMTLAVSDRIQFYSSENLLEWKLESEFGQNQGAHGGVWECPDLIPMTAPDGSEKWVLLVSINPGGPQKGSATQYFIGDFTDGKFTPDDQLIRWLDYGPDNYAGVTWANTPNRNLFIGWMSNWLYAQVVPTETWRSAMTIPRELSLFEVDGTLLVKSAPAEETLQLRGSSFELDKLQSNLPSEAVEITAEIEDEEAFSILIENEIGEKVLITRDNGLVSVDRSLAGNSDFHPDFAAVHSAPMSWEANSLRLFLDASSLELFINDGEMVITSTLFPTEPWKKIRFSENLSTIKLHNLAEIN
ncbi:glycoside hydrolase family 32 protein [Algoriphagus hitonicola]|uniref:Fructan beta-fructosidase n=1 Tax=Algoriphagus hitonicola TaxID=435880 RepID=A0A1I2RLI2_9BACT|nr:glycoside hydrolase family 32 protein [Algoriphagus hitonicola]SFG40329.1 fructan beta-fructosidase [Algoriphagus hitonicola]